ncbi:PREDICTED: coiled-coil domain-containing protein SCD2-like isoform X2 [Camelina sativa]|uniref:Coiled-coil domain-containing protein SCD2-like isoform X2 n=1 Tax=Camelina sativa TaxID=90675 RepID=A0ABM0T6T1_CAMSA|nr:PREDICTED: coiled-coil domain-containing protein SCD2-like isoform X2 [Camelina sativa]
MTTMRNARPVHVRNKSTEPGTPSSPMMTSPLMHLHTRSGSNASSAKKAQTKAAAQRLAAVMSNQTGDDEDSDDDLSFDYNASSSGTGSIGLAAGRSHPSRSPVVRNPIARRPQRATPQLADDDNDDDDFSVDVSSTRPSIGLSSGRAMRPQSPVMTKIAPPRRTPPANEDNKNDDDDDDDVVSVDYTIGRPSIGLGSGRAMRPQSSMNKSQPQGRPVMPVHQPADDDNEDDETPYVYTSGIPSVGLAGGRAARSRSPLTKTPPLRHSQALAKSPANGDGDADFDESYTSGMPSIGLAGGRSMRPRTPLSIRTKEQPQTGLPTSSSRSTSYEDSTEPSAISTLTSHPSQTTNQVEQSASARSVVSNKSSQSLSALDQPPSALSSFSGRPIRTVPLMPSSVPISLKPVTPAFQSDTPTNLRKDKRFSMDLGSSGNLRELGSQRSTSALQDEVDMLQEENESLLEKLRLAEDKCDEADARAKQLEKQVEILGEGVTMDARLLSRKEAALQQREAALRVASQNHGGRREDVSALHTEAEIARDEAASSLEQLHEVVSELNSLKTVTKRLILTQEEMEEVVLKRCWLSRYWGLCVRHGIQADIAGAKHEYWSSFAPLPLEIVLSAGKRARDGVSQSNNTKGEREKSLENLQETSGEGNVESMIWVEKGLRELASLKVQEAVAFVMAQNRRSSSSKFFVSDEVKLPMDGQFEAFELSDEEVEDVSFKQAWLSYFWRRAKNHDIESDLAEERLQYWINQGTRSATSQDAVDVERGLMELRKLNIESQLWQKSRKGLDHESNPSHLELSF